MSNINKIVELQVEVDDLEFEDVGVEIMSLVEEPAIGVHWAAFAAQHLFVNKIPGESEDNYLGRCIPQLISEGYDQEQAAAICYAGFETIGPDKEMIDGVIDILNKVDDLDNRLIMAQELVAEFKKDGIEFDVVDFMNRVGFQNFEINVEGLPTYVDQTGGLKPKVVDLETYQNAILEFASKPEIGEVLDIANTTFVNVAKQEFETITEFLRGVDALDILGQIAGSGAQQVPEPSYRYTGPSAERNFCRALMALGKIYTRNEISLMDGVNFGFGPNGSNFYSVFNYKGGVNCQHYWEQLRVFRTAGGQNIVISEGPAVGLAGESNNSSEPSPTGYVRNNARLASEWKFAEDDDKMIITGPAMKAFQLIPRKDKDGNLFHVYFSDETIKKLSEKFLKEHKQHMTDVNHSMNPDEENNLIESWIVEDPEMDKSRALGFNPTKGDWYVSYKINNEETWKQIKEGKLNGFSIAGQFIERNAK